MTHILHIHYHRPKNLTTVIRTPKIKLHLKINKWTESQNNILVKIRKQIKNTILLHRT